MLLSQVNDYGFDQDFLTSLKNDKHFEGWDGKDLSDNGNGPNKQILQRASEIIEKHPLIQKH